MLVYWTKSKQVENPYREADSNSRQTNKQTKIAQTGTQERFVASCQHKYMYCIYIRIYEHMFHCLWPNAKRLSYFKFFFSMTVNARSKPIDSKIKNIWETLKKREKICPKCKRRERLPKWSLIMHQFMANSQRPLQAWNLVIFFVYFFFYFFFFKILYISPAVCTAVNSNIFSCFCLL